MLATLARNWWAVVLRGVCAVLFGVAALAWPGITLAVLILLYGAYALADGILAIIWSFMSRGRDSFPWGVFLAGLAFDFCVRYSSEDAKHEGFDVVVIEDACRGIDVDGSVRATRARLDAIGVRCLAADTVS